MAAVTEKMEKEKSPAISEWSGLRKAVVGSLATVHLLAVFSAPWASPEPSSDLAKSVSGAFTPYQQFMSLDNGYRFFAPDPGPSHLVRYQVIAGEEVIAEGKFPDIERHWPRLHYHRQFMLSEMMYQLASAVPEVPPGILPDDVMTKSERKQVVLLEERSYALQQSIADHLLAGFPDASSVRLIGQTHSVPGQFDVQRGMELSDQRLYQEVPLGSFTRGGQPVAGPVSDPAAAISDSSKISAEDASDAVIANERSQP